MRPKHLVSLVTALTLVAAACGSDDDTADSTTAATDAPGSSW